MFVLTINVFDKSLICKGYGKKAVIKECLNRLLLPLLFAFAFFCGIKDNAAQTNRDSILIEELTETLREQFRSRQLDSAWVLVDTIKYIARKSGMQVKPADCPRDATGNTI